MFHFHDDEAASYDDGEDYVDDSVNGIDCGNEKDGLMYECEGVEETAAPDTEAVYGSCEPDDYDAAAYMGNELHANSVPEHLNSQENGITFKGYGHCSKCACGGFEGYGQCCTNCGHSYESHY